MSGKIKGPFQALLSAQKQIQEGNDMVTKVVVFRKWYKSWSSPTENSHSSGLNNSDNPKHQNKCG